MLGPRCRRSRLLRVNGRIHSIRSPMDPVFDLDFLDDEVRAYFDEKFRARRIAAGLTTPEAEDELAKAEAAARRGLLHRLSVRRGLR